MNQKNKATDRRLQKTYGITLAEYNQMLKDQNGTCWICNVPPKENRRLHVDHDHKVARTKVQLYKQGRIWFAEARGIIFGDASKKIAKWEITRRLKRLSVRGLLCWHDNTAIQKFRDDPDRMESAAKYIRSYKERLTN